MPKDLIQYQKIILCHTWWNLVIISRGNGRKVHEYSQKSIDDFKLIILNPSPNLSDREKKSVMDYFDYSSQDQCIEPNTKIIMTHILRRWNEDKSITHPSTCALTTAETVSLEIYSIKLKYCSLSLVIYCLNQRQHNDFTQILSEDSVHGVSCISMEI